MRLPEVTSRRGAPMGRGWPNLSPDLARTVCVMTFVICYSKQIGHNGYDPYTTYPEAESAFRERVRDYPGYVVKLQPWGDTGAIGLPLMVYDPHADTPHRWQDSLPGLSPDPLPRAAQIAFAAISLSLDSESCDEMADVLTEAQDALRGVVS